MTIYHKDFSKEELENEDFLASVGNVEALDEKTIFLNRLKMQAILLAESAKADILIERENDDFRITISKKM